MATSLGFFLLLTPPIVFWIWRNTIFKNILWNGLLDLSKFWFFRRSHCPSHCFMVARSNRDRDRESGTRLQAALNQHEPWEVSAAKEQGPFEMENMPSVPKCIYAGIKFLSNCLWSMRHIPLLICSGLLTSESPSDVRKTEKSPLASPSEAWSKHG